MFCSIVPAGANGFSLVRGTEEFFGNIDSMDTNDGKRWFFKQYFYCFSCLLSGHSAMLLMVEFAWVLAKCCVMQVKLTFKLSCLAFLMLLQCFQFCLLPLLPSKCYVIDLSKVTNVVST